MSTDLDNFKLLNTTKTHFIQCIKGKSLSQQWVETEIQKICLVDVVHNAAMNVARRNTGISDYARYIYKSDVSEIIAEIRSTVQKNHIKEFVKNIIKRL